MSLTERCADAFSFNSRAKGFDYFKSGRVSVEIVASSMIIAEVQGSDLYDVSLSTRIDGPSKKLFVSCPCPHYQDGYLCKHIWATLIAVEQKRIPLPITPQGSIEIVQEDYDTKAPPPSLWQLSFEKMEQLTQPQASLNQANLADSPSRSRERRIWYLLDLEDTQKNGQLSISFFIQPFQKGGWGRMKRWRPTWKEIEAIPEGEDRELLSLLLVRQGEEDYQRYHYSYARFQRSLIHPSLHHLLLPRLAATERFGWRQGTDTDPPTPLGWTDGDPWRFDITITTDHDQGWMLWGKIKKEAQEIDLKTPLLLLSNGLVILSDRIERLDANGSFQWLAMLRESGPLKIPLHERDLFIEKIHNSPNFPLRELPNDFQWLIETPPLHPALSILADLRGGEPYLKGHVRFLYNGQAVWPSDPRQMFSNPSEKKLIRRNRPAEVRAIARLKGLKVNVYPESPAGEDNLRLWKTDLTTIVPALLQEEWQVQAEGKSIRSSGAFQINITTGVDWFDLNTEVVFDGIRVPLPALLKARKEGNRFIELGDGSFGLLPDEWLSQFAPLLGLGKVANDKIRLTRSQGALLDALLKNRNETIRFDDGFQKFRGKLDTLNGVEPAKAPAGFKGKLRPYQKQGLGWLRFLNEFRFGGCLADDMGLGKTIQALALLEQRRGRPSLAVVPKSLLHNWMDEATRFTPKLKVLEYSGSNREGLRKKIGKYDLLVMTYSILRKDIDFLKDVRFDIAILDEAQAIKNTTAQVTKASYLITADQRLAMTGTPVENHLGELWSIFEYLNPGMLDRSSAFGLASLSGRQLEPSTVELLSRALRPFILRRTKKQVLKDLPEKTEQTIYCELDPPQRAMYDELKNYYRISLEKRIKTEGLEKSKIHVLEALLRLRQTACHPGLVDKSRKTEESAKVETLIRQTEELVEEGHKTLVFSQFTSFLDIIRKKLEEKGITYEYLDGSTTDRKERVERFQTDPKCPLFLISLKAGGLGLNLTAADYCFLMDPWWNPAVEAQAIDRMHRIGQKKNVFAYRLITRNTVEEKILELQKSKKKLAESVISAEAGFLRKMSMEDLRLLLS